MTYKYFKLQKPIYWLQIKAQYYHLAKQYHPDKQQGSEDHMQAINAEYAILKTKYDPSAKKTWFENLREIDISYQNIRNMQIQAAKMARIFQPALEKQGKEWLINQTTQIINKLPEGMIQRIGKYVVEEQFRVAEFIEKFDLPTELEKFDLEIFVNSLKKATTQK